MHNLVKVLLLGTILVSSVGYVGTAWGAPPSGAVPSSAGSSYAVNKNSVSVNVSVPARNATPESQPKEASEVGIDFILARDRILADVKNKNIDLKAMVKSIASGKGNAVADAFVKRYIQGNTYSYNRDAITAASTSVGKMNDLANEMNAGYDGIRKAETALSTAQNDLNALKKGSSNPEASKVSSEEIQRAEQAVDAAKKNLDDAKAAMSDGSFLGFSDQSSQVDKENAWADSVKQAQNDWNAGMAQAASNLSSATSALNSAKNNLLNSDAFNSLTAADQAAVRAGEALSGEYPPDTKFGDEVAKYQEAATGFKSANEDMKRMEAEGADVQKNTESLRATPTDLWDIPRTLVMVLTPFLAEKNLALNGDINIKGADIAESQAPVDGVSLNNDTGDDETRAGTAVGATMLVKNLLDMNKVSKELLSDKIKRDNEGTITLMGGSVGQHGSQLGVGSGQKPATTGTPKTYKYTDAEVAELKERRAEFLRQYVNAGIQLSEAMNAVSSAFFDRAEAVAQFSSTVQTEGAASGYVQDVGRYVLLEQLRGTVLSSIQMGIASAKLFYEAEIENPEITSDGGTK